MAPPQRTTLPSKPTSPSQKPAPQVWRDTLAFSGGGRQPPTTSEAGPSSLRGSPLPPRPGGSSSAGLGGTHASESGVRPPSRPGSQEQNRPLPRGPAFKDPDYGAPSSQPVSRWSPSSSSAGSGTLAGSDVRDRPPSREPAFQDRDCGTPSSSRPGSKWSYSSSSPSDGSPGPSRVDADDYCATALTPPAGAPVPSRRNQADDDPFPGFSAGHTDTIITRREQLEMDDYRQARARSEERRERDRQQAIAESQFRAETTWFPNNAEQRDRVDREREMMQRRGEGAKANCDVNVERKKRH